MSNLIPFSSLDPRAQAIISRTFTKEGDYVNNPKDSGGPTRWGVTEVKARQYGYEGDMREFPQAFAQDIAAHEFWFNNKLDKVAAISWKIAEEIFDTSYNAGPAGAWKIVQRALNLMNREGKDWSDITADGKVGPKTLDALAAAVKRRGERHVFKCLNVVQGAFYVELTERRQKDEEFFNGWVDGRIELE